jgi:hypothetical protein
MTPIPQAPARPPRGATYLRSVAVAASWLALVALATACFFAPRGAEAQPSLDDVVGFSCSMAIAGAAAAIAAFGIGGRKRWAVQLTLSVVLLGATAAVLLLYFIGVDPTFLRQRMDFWSFERLRQIAPRWAEQLAGYHGPLGAMVGGALGALAGLLVRSSRQRPRVATGAALVVLFAFASDRGRRFTLDLVTWLGWRLRYHLVPWSISDDQISITGMIFGAIAGAVVAGLAMYVMRPRPVMVTMVRRADHSGHAPA